MLFYILFIVGGLDWQVLKTENLVIIYKPGYEYEALQTLFNLEYYRVNVISLTGHNPRRVPVVLEDVGLLSNGYADPFFYNIHIFTNPPNFDYYLEGGEDWFRNVGVHEFTHIAHMTRTAGLSRLLTNAFGSVFQPNMYAPGWLIEGITVYAESQISPYEGRLNDGFFNSYLERRVAQGEVPTLVEVTNEPLSFPYGKIYLYGGEFFDFLAKKYGRESFARFFQVYGSHFWAPITPLLPFLGVDRAASKVYGKRFPALFSEWRDYLKGQPMEKDYKATRLTCGGWYIPTMVSYQHKIYYVREKPIKLGCFRYRILVQLMEYDLKTKKERVFTTIESWLTTKMRLHKNILYFCTAEFQHTKNNIYLNGWGITSVLKKIDLDSKRSERLFSDEIRTFCILDDSTIIYIKNRKGDFGSEIWLATSRKRKKLFEIEYLINDIATDGKKFVVAAKRRFENTDLYFLDLVTGKLELIVSTPWSEGGLDFIDEDLLGFIANYDGRHYPYLAELGDSLKILRNAETGLVNSFVLFDSALIFSGLDINGFDLYITRYPAELYELKPAEPSPAPDFASLDLQIRRGNYFDIAQTLYPAVRIPIFLPTDSTFRKWLYSAVIAGADATGENFYWSWIGYDPGAVDPILRMGLQSYFFSPLVWELFYEFHKRLNIYISHTLYRRLHYGISDITLGIALNGWENFMRKEIVPQISCTGKMPYGNYFGNFSLYYERQHFYSTIDRTGIKGTMGINKILFNGEIRFLINGFYDPQNPDQVSISIRGYDYLKAPKAATFTAEYSHPLLKLRSGFWNPNVYFEDFIGICFFDYAVLPDNEDCLSGGVALGLETKMGFNFIQLLPQIGLAVNRDRAIKIIFGCQVSSAGQSDKRILN